MNKPNGIVNIRGKEYQTVALRVHTFRAQHPDYALVTEVLHRDLDCVVMRATISDATGRIVATGHAEEYRKASEINRTSALENAETSAIGRALAALGLGGTEFASADEVARAISGQKGEPEDPLSIFPAQIQSKLRAVSAAAIQAHNEGNEWGAYETWTSALDDIGGTDEEKRNQVRQALWTVWKPHSALRACIKRFSEAERAEEARLKNGATA